MASAMVCASDYASADIHLLTPRHPFALCTRPFAHFLMGTGRLPIACSFSFLGRSRPN